MEKRRKKLFVKIASFSSLMVVASLIISRIGAVQNSKKALKEELQNSSAQLLRQIDTISYGYVNSSIQQLDFLCKNEDIQDLQTIKQDSEDFPYTIQSNLKSIEDTIDVIGEIYYADEKSGKLIVKDQVIDMSEENFKEKNGMQAASLILDKMYILIHTKIL